MNEFENVVSRNEEVIYGTTMINHRVRVKLGFTIAEYVVAEFIAYANSKRKLVTFEYAYRRTGLDKENLLSIMKSLTTKRIIETVGNDVKITRTWIDAFMISEEWFEAFWKVKGEAFWPGSKPDAKQKFVTICKKYSPEFIIQCRDNYIKFMNHPDNKFRKVMGAPVFLNEKTERFKEDWLGNLKRTNGEVRAPMKYKDFTKKEKDELFS